MGNHGVSTLSATYFGGGSANLRTKAVSRRRPAPPQVSPNAPLGTLHTRTGLPWSAQSCWMDSSMMALFYPDAMHAIMYPYFTRSNVPCHPKIQETVLDIVGELRMPNGRPHLHDLRNVLIRYTPMRGDQKHAFQREHKYGYVFYFLQELLKLFGVPCAFARERGKTRNVALHLLEMESCGTSPERRTVEGCLRSTYADWTFSTPVADLRHLIIELIDEDRYTVEPQEHITFLGKRWALCSLIVFDCSHFISYVKQNGSWYLYDDNRALQRQPMPTHTFNRNFYKRGGCSYQYGVQNTFFFYTREDGDDSAANA